MNDNLVMGVYPLTIFIFMAQTSSLFHRYAMHKYNVHFPRFCQCIRKNTPEPDGRKGIDGFEGVFQGV